MRRSAPLRRDLFPNTAREFTEAGFEIGKAHVDDKTGDWSEDAEAGGCVVSISGTTRFVTSIQVSFDLRSEEKAAHAARAMRVIGIRLAGDKFEAGRLLNWFSTALAMKGVEWQQIDTHRWDYFDYPVGAHQQAKIGSYTVTLGTNSVRMLYVRFKPGGSLFNL